MAPYAHPWSAGTKSAGGRIAWTLTSPASWVPVPKSRLAYFGYLIGKAWKCFERISWFRRKSQTMLWKYEKATYLLPFGPKRLGGTRTSNFCSSE